MFFGFRKKKRPAAESPAPASPAPAPKPQAPSGDVDMKAMRMLVSKVLELMAEAVNTNVPEKGIFPRQSIGLILPDREYHGLLSVAPGRTSEERAVSAGVHPADGDRLVSNYLFFGTTEELRAWFADPARVDELIDTYLHLRESARSAD